MKRIKEPKKWVIENAILPYTHAKFNEARLKAEKSLKESEQVIKKDKGHTK